MGCRDGAGQTSRACAYYDDIRVIFKDPATFSSENTQSPYKPRPPEVTRVFEEAGITHSSSGLSGRQPPDHVVLKAAAIGIRVLLHRHINLIFDIRLSRRQHADHRQRPVIEAQYLPQHLRISTEAAAPIVVTEHGHLRSIGRLSLFG